MASQSNSPHVQCNASQDFQYCLSSIVESGNASWMPFGQRRAKYCFLNQAKKAKTKHGAIKTINNRACMLQCKMWSCGCIDFSLLTTKQSPALRAKVQHKADKLVPSLLPPIWRWPFFVLPFFSLGRAAKHTMSYYRWRSQVGAVGSSVKFIE